MTQPKPHKHADLIRQWADLVAKGEVDAGWWTANSKIEGFENLWALDADPKFLDYKEWRIMKSDRHPDNAKPKIDWSKVPVGAMTGDGVFLGVNGSGNLRVLLEAAVVMDVTQREEKLTQMTMWFDGEPTQEQRDLFEIEDRSLFAPVVRFAGHVWRIKGWKNG